MKRWFAAVLAALAVSCGSVVALAQEPLEIENFYNYEMQQAEEQPALEELELVVKADEDGVRLEEDLLEPGERYRFPVALRTADGTEIPITDSLLEDYRFTYTRLEGKGIQQFEVEDYRGDYYLHVELADSRSSQLEDGSYRVKLLRRSDRHPVANQRLRFTYGYQELENSYLKSLEKGETVEISNAAPVLTQDQLERIAELNDYRRVTLAGEDWSYTVLLSDEEDKNFRFTNAGAKEILQKYPDQDFKFFTFSGTPSFATTGTVVLDVSDVEEAFGQLYTYRYADGRLYYIKAVPGEEEGTLTFRTRRLDTFLVTNRSLPLGEL